jgi:hypothetical protein
VEQDPGEPQGQEHPESYWKTAAARQPASAGIESAGPPERRRDPVDEPEDQPAGRARAEEGARGPGEARGRGGHGTDQVHLR